MISIGLLNLQRSEEHLSWLCEITMMSCELVMGVNYFWVVTIRERETSLDENFWASSSLDDPNVYLNR